jgi:hypothetical protein
MEIEGSKCSPSSFGHFTETIFDEYPIYKFHIPLTIIDNYLPNKLTAFPSVTWTNMAKHHFFYSKPIIFASRSQLSGDTEPLPSTVSLDNLLEELLSKNDSALRYNFVIMGDCLIFARIPRHRHVSYHLLCKHVTLSNRSTDVRFAGELWRDENYYFRLNNNSGTYWPSDLLIEQTVKLFNQLTPSLQFEGISFKTSAQPSTKQRIVLKMRRKLNIKHDQHVV